MAITASGCQFLLAARAAGVDFTETATLGRQGFSAKLAILSPIAAAFGLPGGAPETISRCGRSGDKFLELLGARMVTSFDASDYEGASVVCDLNEPLPETHHQKFSAVFDGGTIEHVFNAPQALKNSMQLVRIGGHFVSVNPTNNYMGHGFYQFSSDFFYQTLTPENGFEIVAVMFCTTYGDPPRFYGIRSPQVVQTRCLLENDCCLDVMVIAKRTADKEIFAKTPQQKFYSTKWESASTRSAGSKDSGKHPRDRAKSLTQRVADMLPQRVRKIAKAAFFSFKPEKNRRCFYPLSLDQMVRGEVRDPSLHTH